MRIVSAPFGNYIQPEGWVPTLGTFTPKYRGGLLYRSWRCLKTLRYDRKRQGWTNKLGLPNPGIDWLMDRRGQEENKIVSLGLAADDTFCDLERMLRQAEDLNPLYYELNVSCPNEKRGVIATEIITAACHILQPKKLIIKLPPVQQVAIAFMDFARFHGVRLFHLCNTIPTERGGLSGPSLIPIVSQLVREACQQYPDVSLIAGGGVQNQSIATLYKNLGAEHFAVGSAWLNPLNWSRLREIA